MRIDASRKLIVYAPGEFGGREAKTAEGAVRFLPHLVSCVVDAKQAGKSVREVLASADSIEGADSIPVVASMDEALSVSQGRAEAMLLGCAFIGGRMPESWRSDILRALDSGLDVINGLHDFLCDDRQFRARADEKGVQLIDLRSPPDKLVVAAARAASVKASTVLTVGSDCSVGKMTASLEILKEAQRRGHRAGFVATGQTGILISGLGVAIDRVIGDFMAGVMEDLVLEAACDRDFVFIEGQGSICHPGYSGVTLSLLHGAAPQCMILCHKEGRERIEEHEIRIPSLSELVSTYERLSRFVRPAQVVGICVDTRSLDEQKARAKLGEYEVETGLTATDPVRFGCVNIMDAIESYCRTEAGACSHP